MRATQVALALAACAGGTALCSCGDAAPAGRALGGTPAPSGQGPERPSANDVLDVQRAWWTVKQALPLRYLGLTLLMTFLKLYPEHSAAFAGGAGGGAGGSGEEQQQQVLAAPAVALAYDLTALLDSVDDLALAEALARRTGRRRRDDGASQAALDDMRDLILHLLARYHKQYAEMFPLGIVESSARTLNWIFAMMKKGMQPETQRNAEKEKRKASH